MQIEATDFAGLYVITPRVFNDERGYFFESYNDSVFKNKHGMDFTWVQDNQSRSKYGVIRGLHMQKAPHAQTKLIRVLQGEILDVVVDMRKSEKTFGKVFSIQLSADNKKQLFIPKGFVHGFSVLSETADVLYKIDDFYHKESEVGVIYNDAELNIDWKVPVEKQLVSEKDLVLPAFKEATYYE
ncbi:MAG: dTDP-4-dehydrorhamnose 3,5-epimerase [Chitinophagia bacterium]|jgi:dTDP-4-dehydrorhamnose 3,5-epimerase|nr:dTDP-4-dehydrorhamnose 3,5-epimerase [Chitinophagia bacterium]